MSLPYLLFHVLTYERSHRELSKLQLLLTVTSGFTACAGHACVCDGDRHGRRRETESRTDRQTGWREVEGISPHTTTVSLHFPETLSRARATWNLAAQLRLGHPDPRSPLAETQPWREQRSGHSGHQ